MKVDDNKILERRGGEGFFHKNANLRWCRESLQTFGERKRGSEEIFFSSFSFFSYWGNCNCSCCRIVDWCFLNLPPSRNLRGLWSRSMIRATGEHFSCSRDRDWFFVLSFSLIVERITAIQLRCTTNFKRYSVWRNEKKKKRRAKEWVGYKTKLPNFFSALNIPNGREK